MKPPISKLHYVTTTAHLAEQACKAGIDWIQLRLKQAVNETCRATALAVQEVCRQYGATLIINDHVRLALEIQADGVHIGKEDMPPAEASRLLGSRYLIGCTANTFEDIGRLPLAQIDYIGLGPFRFTHTKQNLSPVLRLEGYHAVLAQAAHSGWHVPPVIGIGGITGADVPALLASGLWGVALSGAISQAPDPAAAAAALHKLCHPALTDHSFNHPSL